LAEVYPVDISQQDPHIIDSTLLVWY
jgi:hypothetical protein